MTTADEVMRSSRLEQGLDPHKVDLVAMERVAQVVARSERRSVQAPPARETDAA